MDFGTERSLADYFMTGLYATMVNSDLDALTVLVALRKMIDTAIDDELDKWSNSLDPDDE